MASRIRSTALLDACVLYPIAMTDALLSLATAGFFAAKWTTLIEREWIAALERQRPDLTGRLDIRRDSMREAIPDWEVPEAAWGRLTASLSLPDPADRHVLAAAIAGQADFIVTSNLRHFPASLLSEFGIEAMDPDSFVVSQWDLDPANAISAFRKMRARRRSPSAGAKEFADALARGGLPATAHRLLAVADLI